MFGEDKNLKDTKKNPIKDTLPILPLIPPWPGVSGSYTKTSKLITGLYMVTDILDKEEPIRNHLRTLGSNIISDIYTLPIPFENLAIKISEILSFLDIASAVGIISQMNCNILKKEFLQLQESITINTNTPIFLNGDQITLSEFFKIDEGDKIEKSSNYDRGQNFNSIGHNKHTRIGIQKGHTLMKALSDKLPSFNDAESNHKQRREEIIQIIKNNPNGLTITDIKKQAHGSLVSCGEKTIQRELFSMVRDNVLKRVGEKRWSRYFIKS